MKIITISREFGSGGRELGQRLAEALGFDYYDSEILTTVAKRCGIDDKCREVSLRDHGWRNIPITFHGTMSSLAYIASFNTDVVLRQNEVIREIASYGKDFVIVGRNADVLLREYSPLNIFVYSSEDTKIKRCMERVKDGEKISERELIRKMKEIDKRRARSRELVSETPWGERSSYHLSVSTDGWEIESLADSISDFATKWFLNYEKSSL